MQVVGEIKLKSSNPNFIKSTNPEMYIYKVNMPFNVHKNYQQIKVKNKGLKHTIWKAMHYIITLNYNQIITGKLSLYTIRQIVTLKIEIITINTLVL